MILIFMYYALFFLSCLFDSLSSRRDWALAAVIRETRHLQNPAVC